MDKVVKSRAELEEEGWKAASVSGGEHLKRILEMYQELGMETYLEEITPQECGDCTECYLMGNETIYRIYTRREEE